MNRIERRKLSGNRLRELRKEKGLSQQKIADLLGIPQQYIQRYESGAVQLPDEYAESISMLFPEYLQEWLLGLSNIKTKDGLALEQLIERKSHEADIKTECIKLIAKEQGYDISLYTSGFLGRDGKIVDSYIVRKGEKQTEIVLNYFIDELADFIGFKLNRLLENGGNENGKH